jgi:nucleoside-diphosphate-sugar epimerase/predicted dehydrogenase
MVREFHTGLVGVDPICELHVQAMKQLPEIELIGIVDFDRKRAQAKAEPWGTIALDSFEQIVDAGANVVHILTPLPSRAKLVLAALAKGCHVLIEAPIAETPADVLAIQKLAAAKELTVTAAHTLLFDPQIIRALAQVKAGAIGELVSVEIVRSARYPAYEGGARPPWVASAGYPVRDLGTHAAYVIQAFLGQIDRGECEWSSSGSDPDLAYDEWHGKLHCQRGLGEFHLAFGKKPQHHVIIQGTSGVIDIDLLAAFSGTRATSTRPNVAERIANAVTGSLQPLLETPVGLWKRVRKDDPEHRDVRALVGDFYARLAAREPGATDLEEVAEVIKWIDHFARTAETEHAAKLAAFTTAASVPYLVTGASGSLGKAMVHRLVSEGHKVRAFVRRMPERREPNVEYAFGNLGDPDAVDRAVAGAEIVIHAGAATRGGWPEHKGSTVVGTANVIAACKKHKVKQLVHISSMSVVDWAGSAGNGAVSEDTNLEPRAEERGAYTQAKLAAERSVVDAAAAGLPAVILRPGQIFGGGIPLINGAVARDVGPRWIVLGDGKLELPLVYIDDVVDAILGALAKQLTKGEVIQIIDPEHLTQADVLDLAGGTKKVVHVPRPVVFALGKLSELPLGVLGRQSPIAQYRLKSALAQLRYESNRASTLLGWKPRVGVREGIKRVRS